ncbi:uncharacterized protein LOC128554232, partial [Mercenaria mercenaria]|uniref:uncharacterized protein LOC128554232 n=1 Tax=Mercenaria mercenaria TaxID=6596 RepID=UPI00234EF9FB
IAKYDALMFWRLVFICGFVLILFLVAKATNDLVTLKSAMFLLDTEAMLPILERQNDVTNAVISEYGSYLNDFLVGYTEKLDGELQMVNNILLNVAERQNMLLNTMISDMCNLAGLDICTDGTNLVTMSLTSCNFLPIHAKMFEGFHKSVLLEYIQRELSPLVLNLRSILFSSMYLLLACAAAMLLCQVTARVIYVHLKNSRHMKITKIYQLPSTMSDQWHDQQSLREKEMYNSQSVIAESYESGVYDMTN